MQNLNPEYVLSRHWSESAAGIELRYWLVSKQERSCWRIPRQESVCFIEQIKLDQWQMIWKRNGHKVRIGEGDFKCFNGETARPVYSQSYFGQRKWVRSGKEIGLKVWEDDINPADRFLMERFLFGSLVRQGIQAKPAAFVPKLKVLSIDIETSWFEPGKTPDLYSVALSGENLAEVFIVNQGQINVADQVGVNWAENIKDCLTQVINSITDYDPDCIIGWNVVDFDLRILQEHCDAEKIKFSIGRENTAPNWRMKSGNARRYYIELEGRQVVDGPGAFRSAAWFFDDFSLETVSRNLLNRGKQIDHSDDQVDEIERLYRHDVPAFVAYNLEDAQLVIDLFEKAGLWQFLIERSHLTGIEMDRVGGSSAAFNTVYLPRLHRQGYIAPNIGEQTSQLSSPGGFVMDSIPGIYKDVLVLDFKSLYPSIIRTFLIDSLGLHEGLNAPEQDSVPGFLGARFHRSKHILPALIDQLWQARDQAKAEKNAPMSQAIKIIMNSFYGVLGSNLCRFFDPRLASSITMRGHEILQKSREFIEAKGYTVIYGDTDSVFVHATNHVDPKALGGELAAELNVWWKKEILHKFNLTCHLEMEFETHYERFVMPTIRGTDRGSKKRYAGWIKSTEGHEIIFKGLEAVRTDWTPLAKKFQRELYLLVFLDQDYKPFISATVAALKNGELDDDVVYRRRLRREIEQYEKNVPPHVQASWLKRQHQPSWRGRTVEYVKTVQGWQPIPYVTSTIDYDHYIEKQLAPIADALIHFFNEDFYSLIDDQMRLF